VIERYRRQGRFADPRACGCHALELVQRIWRASGLQPHRAETFKLSTDLLFVENMLKGPFCRHAPGSIATRRL